MIGRQGNEKLTYSITLEQGGQQQVGIPTISDILASILGKYSSYHHRFLIRRENICELFIGERHLNTSNELQFLFATYEKMRATALKRVTTPEK